MTAPAMRKPEDQPPPPPPTEVEEPPDEDSALVPALLIIFAAYMAWRGSHHSIPRTWRQVSVLLNLRGIIGTQLAMVAARSLDRQRQDAGRAGDELWAHTTTALQAGVDAGVQAIAEALIWTDRNIPDGTDPVTKDAADARTPGPAIPTAGQPPELLARLAVSATTNAAVLSMGTSAGWLMKQWLTKRDNRVRETHVALQGKKVPVASPFVSPSGAKLRYPGDPRAPLAERANCRCYLRMARR